MASFYTSGHPKPRRGAPGGEREEAPKAAPTPPTGPHKGTHRARKGAPKANPARGETGRPEGSPDPGEGRDNKTETQG